MEEKSKPLMNSCDFMGVKPIMVDLPYPPVQVKEKNGPTPIYSVLTTAAPYRK